MFFILQICCLCLFIGGSIIYCLIYWDCYITIICSKQNMFKVCTCVLQIASIVICFVFDISVVFIFFQTLIVVVFSLFWTLNSSMISSTIFVSKSILSSYVFYFISQISIILYVFAKSTTYFCIFLWDFPSCYLLALELPLL